MMQRTRSLCKILPRSGFLQRTRLNSNFVVLGDDSAFEKLKESNGKKIYYFTASWCPPCKAIGPIFEKLSKTQPLISFVKIDVDQLPETAQEHNIRSVPTFKFVNGQTLIAEFSGADQTSLQKNLDLLSSAN